MEVIVIQNIESVEKSSCTGCGVCANACTSITMRADEEGFLYPAVNRATCSDCGNCVACCPVICPPPLPEKQKDHQVYAAWSLDEKVRYNSTSGGVFTELAKVILQHNGYVVGARYNNNHLVEHTMITRIEDIAKLRQSKYVQSETKNIYMKVEEALQTKKPVLFVGTPCQCVGLKTFLQKSYKNLIICDFICRGVNSPKVYLKYLKELEEKYGSRIKQVWFKNKTYGWNKFCTKIIFEDGQEYLGGRDTDPFMYGYIKQDLNLYMRPSCGNCKFKGERRPVDITLGDFWGVNLHESNRSTDYGVSVVIVATPKGRHYLELCEEVLYLEKHVIQEVIPYNKCIIESAENSLDLKKEFNSLINNCKLKDAIDEIKQKNWGENGNHHIK